MATKLNREKVITRLREKLARIDAELTEAEKDWPAIRDSWIKKWEHQIEREQETINDYRERIKKAKAAKTADDFKAVGWEPRHEGGYYLYSAKESIERELALLELSDDETVTIPARSRLEQLL